MRNSRTQAEAKRLIVPEATSASRLPNSHSNDAQSSTPIESCFFFKLPPELRDKIYDDVAAAEVNIGLKVTLKHHSSPKVAAYSVRGLSHTCKQIRQEYSNRLQHRIKRLRTETVRRDCHKFSPEDVFFAWLRKIRRRTMHILALETCARSHVIRVADRKTSKGIYAQEDVAVTMQIPFTGRFDHGIPTSNLTLTFASDLDGAYNLICPLDTRLRAIQQEKFWKERGRFHTLWEAASELAFLLKRTDWNGCEHWLWFWWKYQVLYKHVASNAGLPLDAQARWVTFLGYFV